MSTDDRMTELKQELESLLEERITDLAGTVMAVQEVTRRIAATDGEIARQQAIHDKLVSDYERLEAGSTALEKENGKLQKRVNKLRKNVRQMKKLRAEMMTSLSGLSGELKGLAAGE